MRHLKNLLAATAVLVSSLANAGPDDSMHNHPAPEKLGIVHFENSCAKAERRSFDRAVALLHSFAYEAATREFNAIAARDPGCALAHWGSAMTEFHQLWSPPGVDALQLGRNEIGSARRVGARTAREHELIDAAATFFSDTEPANHPARAKAYVRAMESVAQHFPRDDEMQILYALALIGTAAPTDTTHPNQKRAAAILEPIYRRQPNHPGAAHYLIHAYDSTELAPLGLPAARAYAKIAPAAPHALHMPSHIFTRLGLWEDSIESNEAARRVAHEQGDVGEELHAMDYLTYAYLQQGREDHAAGVVQELRAMGPMLSRDFKVSYAATAMPVRLAIERRRWNDALNIDPLPGSPPHVAAIVYWGRALAHAKTGQPDPARDDMAKIDDCRSQAASHGDAYWAAQVEILSREARAWIQQSAGHPEEAESTLRSAAESEDALEKLPVTPGPIVPAREQLGELLLELQRPKEALEALTQSLKEAPRRRAALIAAVRAAELAGDSTAADSFRRLLPR